MRAGVQAGEETLAPRTALALVALGAAVISVTALFVKWISLGPATIGAYRCAFAAAALGGWMLAQRSLNTGPKGQVDASPRALGFAVAAGVCFAGDLFVWHESILLSRCWRARRCPGRARATWGCCCCSGWSPMSAAGWRSLAG